MDLENVGSNQENWISDLIQTPHDLPTRAGAMALLLSRTALLRCIEAGRIQRKLTKSSMVLIMKS